MIMSKMVKEVIHANGIDIRIYTADFQNEYISLTDIAKYKNSEDPRFVIQNWMRNRDTIEFLGLWEILSNPNFNRVQFEAVKKDAGLNRFVMTPTKWCEEMNSIGIRSKAGRYGGTYAHSDIAFEFASWISPEFKLYIIKDYSKLNYRIHTDAIKANLIPPELTSAQISYTYASEADMLNVVLFGKTAKQWRDENQNETGNIRDQATIYQLLVLSNMESYNAILIQQEKSQAERMKLLHELAVQQMTTMSTLDLKKLPGIEVK